MENSITFSMHDNIVIVVAQLFVIYMFYIALLTARV